MLDADVLRALLAGLIAGSAAALATSAVALVALARDERWRTRPPNLKVPMPLVGVAFVNALLFGWTLLGLVLGAGLLRVESARPDGGLGSPNVLFTSMVVGLIGVSLGLGAVVRGRVTWPMWVTGAIALVCFGWLLPGLGTPR